MGHFFFMKEGGPVEPEPESERPILHVGGTQALFTHNIPNQIQYAALGHLHRYHAVGKNPFPVVYSSSPLAYSFSEADQKKQVIIIQAEPEKAVDYRAVALEKGRPLYRKTFDDLAAQSQHHGKEMHGANDGPRMAAMDKMMDLMKSGEMDSWMAARKAEFEAL